MSVSLCMIVKNEEESLPRCLESVKSLVDEIIIVDTGSEDATVRIAKRYGAKIYTYSWNDSFADARNYSISKASGEWLLIMDADDELYHDDAEKLIALVNDPQAKNVYYMKTLCFTGTVPELSNIILNLNVRLIRNGLGYHFEGNIHEHPVGDENTPNVPMATVDIRFYHYGYLQHEIDSKAKRKRNINLLEKELKNKPNDELTLFYMANEYYAAKDFETSIIFFEKSLSLCNPANSLFTKILFRIIMCYYIKGDYERAIQYIKHVLSYYPGFTDAEMLRGIIRLKQMRKPEAIRSLNKCLRMGETQPILCNINGAGSYQPHVILCDIYYSMGQYPKSRYHCYKAIMSGALTTRQFVLMHQLLTLLKIRPDLIRRRLVRYASLGGAAAYLMVSDIYYDNKQYDDALYLLKKAENSDCDETYTPLIAYYKGRCFFEKKEYAKAARCFKTVVAGEYTAKANYFAFLCENHEDEK